MNNDNKHCYVDGGKVTVGKLNGIISLNFLPMGPIGSIDPS